MAPVMPRRPSSRAHARPALAAAIHPLSAALFAAAMLLLSAAAARAEEGVADSGSGLSVGGELAVAHSFKPAVVKGEDAGRYETASLSVSVGAPQVAPCTAGASQTIVQAHEPDYEVTQADPGFSLGCGLVDDGGSARLSLGLSGSPGWSKTSRETFYYGNVRPSMSLSKKIERLTVGLGFAYTRHFHRYTLAASGAANTKQTRSASFFAQLALGGGVTAGVNLAYVMREPYEGLGDPRYGYANGASLGWSITDALSVEASLATSDSQLAADGSDRNEYALYQRSKTELTLGAAYAL
jgi:hypothetical protein